MKHKQLYLATIFTLFALIAIGQNNYDEIKMKDGTTIVGKYFRHDDSYITFRIGQKFADYEVIKIPMSDVDKMNLQLGEGREKSELVNSFNNFHVDVNAPAATSSTLKVKDTGFHLKRGGRFGIAGVSFLVAGSIFETVGIIKGIPGLTYTGVAMSGLGGIFLIVPFGQMIRAGNKYPKQAN